MRTIQVEIKGDTLLQHSPKSMLDIKPTTSKKNKVYDHKEEAEKSAYRSKDGSLFIPSQAIFSCILNGSAFKKIGRFSVKSYLAGNMRIEPSHEVPLLDNKGKPITEYEIDLRTVVIQRKSRIVRARPMIQNWSAKFNIIYNEQFITDDEIIKECLSDAGTRVGLLEYRPQLSGSYGTFDITTWKVLPKETESNRRVSNRRVKLKQEKNKEVDE